MSSEQSHLSQSIVAGLEELQQALTEDIAQRSKARKTLADLLKALAENDVDAAVRLEAGRVRQVVDLCPQIQPTIERLSVDLNRRQEEQLRQTSLQLEEYCRSEGLAVLGRLPKYTVDHFISVELDRKKGRSKVGVQSLGTLKWSSIRETLETERARLWQRPFEAADFRDRLMKVHRDVERAAPSATGWVPLEDAYQILKQEKEQADSSWRAGGRLVAYFRDEFQVDLSKLWEAQASRGVVPPHIALSAIRDPRRAFKLLQPDGNVGSYGFFRPQEAKQ